MPQNTQVLISGASIAGPALAFWLSRYGFDVTVVEKAPDVRKGGQPVDFKGATHRTVLERMGILDAVRQARSPSGGDGVVVNAAGRKVATVPAEFSSGEVEIARGDLAQILFKHTAKTASYMFDDSIASLSEINNGVRVNFQRSAPRVFDLVVGADGIHSNVRKLAFGPETNYVRYLAACRTGVYFNQADGLRRPAAVVAPLEERRLLLSMCGFEGIGGPDQA